MNISSISAPPAPRKRFGQHFLHDPGVLARLVSAIAPQPGECLVEIGPGRGALTLPLLQIAKRLEVIELDRDVIPYLEARCSDAGDLLVHQADALAFDFSLLARQKPLRLVGNLPYNVATPLLFHLLDQLHPVDAVEAPRFVDMHFMLQHEVVERLAASPGNADYGRLSVMIQCRCSVDRLFTVPAGAFHPPPQVKSSVVRLRPHVIPPIKMQNHHLFSLLVRQAFSQRRKTIRNTLRGLLTESAIQEAGVDPGARPEVLSLVQFACLAESLQEIQGGHTR